MAYTYSQLIEIKNRISTDLAEKENALDNHVAQFTVIEAHLAGLPAKYTGYMAEVNAYLAANPNDDAAKVLKAEVMALAAEFTAKRARAEALKAAVDGI